MLGYLPWERPASWDDRPCVRDEREALTYAQFAERVDAFAAQLSENGVGRRRRRRNHAAEPGGTAHRP